MTEFHWQSDFPVSRKELFDWHERAGAFERLSPPWQKVESVVATGGIRDGGIRQLRLSAAGIPVNWRLEHRNYRYGENFSDIQVSGPFRSWQHDHRFSATDGNGCSLEDVLEYEAPGCIAGRVIGEPIISVQLERLFRFRHRQTLLDVTRPWYGDSGGLRVAVTGASGAIGRALCALLETLGCTVLRLSRRNGDVLCWDYQNGTFPSETLEGIDAFIHLAGAPIARRWNNKVKAEITRSRVDGTAFVVASLSQLKRPPAVFVCSSAIGFYGAATAGSVDEQGAKGEGFLAGVCDQWETAAEAARAWAERVVIVRTGVVLDPLAGALQKLLTPFQLGLGGPVGDGRQMMSWIGRDDLLDTYACAVIQESLDGVVNAVAPHAADNRSFSRTLAHVLGRPALIPAPQGALRAAFGEMADETILASQSVQPGCLLEIGFPYRHPDLETCLRFYLGR